MRRLEDAVVELHALEERACGRGSRPGASVDRAHESFGEASDALASLDLLPDDRARATALLDTVGMLLALRTALGDASIAARVLN
jgi:hypothetical protein